MKFRRLTYNKKGYTCILFLWENGQSFYKSLVTHHCCGFQSNTGIECTVLDWNAHNYWNNGLSGSLDLSLSLNLLWVHWFAHLRLKFGLFLKYSFPNFRTTARFIFHKKREKPLMFWTYYIKESSMDMPCWFKFSPKGSVNNTSPQ
jgi:hypothetical protein